MYTYIIYNSYNITVLIFIFQYCSYFYNRIQRLTVIKEMHVEEINTHNSFVNASGAKISIDHSGY